MILGECAVCPIRAGIKSDEVPVPGTSQNANTESASKGVSLDIENYCTLSSFFIISGFFGNVIFWMLRRSCGDIEHR